MANGFSQGIQLGQAFMQGRDRRKADALLDVLGSSQSPQLEPEFQKLIQIAPERAQALLGASKLKDAGRLDAMLKDAKKTKFLLQSGNTQGAMDLLSNRAQQISQLGGTSEETKEIFNDIRGGNIDDAINKLNMFESAFDPNFKPTKSRDKVTANIADYLFAKEIEKTDPEGAQAFRNKSGLSKLDPAEQAKLEVETSRLKEEDKKKAVRLGGYVSNGVGAADGVANLKRTLSLLDTVDTGGFDRAALSAKQLFGVEGADEGELSANLGKAVLSQLRSTFGAAFTEKEGDRLARIEAGFGRNPETNKRLIKNTLTISERAAKRGIRAAKELGSDFEADEIRLALEATLNPDFPQAKGKMNSPALGREVTQQEIRDIMNRSGLSEAEVKRRLGL